MKKRESTHKRILSFFTKTMTDKEIRNKMYALFSDFAREHNPAFKMNNAMRAPIREILEEYRNFFSNPKPVVSTKNEGEWKQYPETK